MLLSTDFGAPPVDLLVVDGAAQTTVVLIVRLLVVQIDVTALIAFAHVTLFLASDGLRDA